MVISVFRFVYEKPDGSNFIACVAAHSIEEAQEYLKGNQGVGIRISEQGVECRLDAITDRVRSVIVENSEPKKRGPGRPPKPKEAK